MIHRIHESCLTLVEAKIAKLIRKAVKLGLTPPTLLHWGEDRVTDENGLVDTFALLSVEGDAPVLNGWELLGVIEHTGDSEIGNVVRPVPGRELPVASRTAKPYCDHCKTHRRRSETFVVAQGEKTLQIGRNCLADFCRDAGAAEGIVGYYEVVTGFEDVLEESAGSRGSVAPTRIDTHALIAVTKTIIRTHGWVSVTESQRDWEKLPTRNRVQTFFFGRDKDAVQFQKEVKAARTEADDAFTTEALAWVRGLRADVDSLADYLYNLLVVCSAESVDAKHVGLACSLPAAYDRHLGVEREARKPRVPSEWVGVPKKRQEFELEFVDDKRFESRFGTVALLRFVEGAGNEVVYWTDADRADDWKLAAGEKARFKATVKEHGEYKGVKQTSLSRAVKL